MGKIGSWISYQWLDIEISGNKNPPSFIWLLRPLPSLDCTYGLDVVVSTKPFRFKEMWLFDPGCSRVVEAVWSSNDMVDPSTKVMRKVEKCGKELKMWNWDHFGNVRKELAKKRRFLVDGEKEAIPNSFTVEPLKERGKIQYRRFELHLVIGHQILKKYRSAWLTIFRSCLPQQIYNIM